MNTFPHHCNNIEQSNIEIGGANSQRQYTGRDMYCNIHYKHYISVMSSMSIM